MVFIANRFVFQIAFWVNKSLRGRWKEWRLTLLCVVFGKNLKRNNFKVHIDRQCHNKTFISRHSRGFHYHWDVRTGKHASALKADVSYCFFASDQTTCCKFTEQCVSDGKCNFRNRLRRVFLFLTCRSWSNALNHGDNQQLRSLT